MAATRKYPIELRERAVRLYRESDPKPVITQLARQLNVHPEVLRNWTRQDEADRGERDDRPTMEMLKENRRLRAEVKGTAGRQRSAEGGECLFRPGDRPDPEEVMNFVDAHNVSVDLVLRVLGRGVELLRRPPDGLVPQPADERGDRNEPVEHDDQHGGELVVTRLEAKHSAVATEPRITVATQGEWNL